MWTVISSEVKEDKKVPELARHPLPLVAPFFDPMYRRFRLQAEKSSESEEGAETGEDGEEGEKEEKQKDGEEKAESPREEDDPKRHGFLILSREESTMVRKTISPANV